MITVSDLIRASVALCEGQTGMYSSAKLDRVRTIISSSIVDLPSIYVVKHKPYIFINNFA